MLHLPLQRPLLSSVPPWVLAGATLDFDFENARYYQQGGSRAIDQIITCSRASTGYVDDRDGNWTAIGNNLPRIGRGKGLLVEEARTNSIRNNSMQGAGAGAPGTLPLNWTYNDGASGIAANVVSVGLENGIDYIDIQFLGTPSITGFNHIQFDTINVSNGQSWGSSGFFKLVGGSLTNVAFTNLLTTLHDGSGVFLSNLINVSFTPTSVALGKSRVVGVGTIANASAGQVKPTTVVGFTSGLPIDVTIRFGLPQTELGASVTSPIRTTTVSVARAADAVVGSVPFVAGDAYTVLVVGIPNNPNTYAAAHQHLLQLDNGSNAQSLILRRQAATANAAAILIGGTGGVILNSGVWSQFVSGKLAVAVSAGSQAASFNGANPSTLSAATLPAAPSVVRFGGDNGSGYFAGYIPRAVVWPTLRLPNADLQRLTA